MALPLKWMPAYSYGGRFQAGMPTVVVVHCTESDNTPAMAEALAGPGWFGGPKAGTSAHKVVDVDSICEGVRRTMIAYHAGPGGNVRGIAYEFCGRASWTAAKWREPVQLQMLRNAAPHIAADLRAISAQGRWLSLAQLAGGERGMCTHNDIRLVFGGTTHSDPGPNFPYAELLAYVQAELGGTPAAATTATVDLLEDPMQLPVGETVLIPVPSGQRAVLTVAADSVSGAVVYGKAVAIGGTATALLPGADRGWLVWVAPGKRLEVDVTELASVELVNRGAEDPRDRAKSIPALASAVLTVVPK